MGASRVSIWVRKTGVDFFSQYRKPDGAWSEQLGPYPTRGAASTAARAAKGDV